MKNAVTTKILNRMEQPQTAHTYYDAVVEGLSLTVEPSGERIWQMSCGCWTTKLTLPAASELSFVREKAIIALSELSAVATKSLISTIQRAGLSPVGDIPQNYRLSTLQELINEYTAAGGSRFIKTTIYGHFNLSMDLQEITVLWAEQWRNKFIEQGHKIATGNRTVSALRTLLNWGEERGLCAASLAGIKMLKEVDSEIITRFLSEEEDQRLREALTHFDKVFQTLIILELNTGIRLKALLCLKWEDINFENNSITLRATNAKSNKTDYTGMNSEAKKYLLELPRTGEYLFINPRTGTRYKNITKKWKKLLRDAEIENLRFHDLRHNLASQLIKKGVSMARIAACLTHSDPKVTKRYAHLNLSDKLEDLELLVKK